MKQITKNKSLNSFFKLNFPTFFIITSFRSKSKKLRLNFKYPINCCFPYPIILSSDRLLAQNVSQYFDIYLALVAFHGFENRVKETNPRVPVFTAMSPGSLSDSQRWRTLPSRLSPSSKFMETILIKDFCPYYLGIHPGFIPFASRKNRAVLERHDRLLFQEYPCTKAMHSCNSQIPLMPAVPASAKMVAPFLARYSVSSFSLRQTLRNPLICAIQTFTVHSFAGLFYAKC